MDNVRNVPGIQSGVRVQERNAGGGGKASAEAFRRALQQEGTPGSTPRDVAEPPLRRSLQQKPIAGRKDDGALAGHVDVLA